MKEKNAVYGFVLSLFEYIETIPTLWDATKSVSFPFPLFRDVVISEKAVDLLLTHYVCQNREFVASRPDLKETMKGNALEFVSEDGGETYNRCHCESACSFRRHPSVRKATH